MANNDPRTVFVLLLSNLRHSAERTEKFYQEASAAVQDQDVKQTLESRALVSSNILNSLDECFKLIGEKPVKPTGRLNDIFVEDFRNELGAIQSPRARRLFVLAKIHHLINLRKGEYVALIAAADLTGHHGVGVLLESCLADKLAFGKRIRRLIRARLMEKAETA